MWKQFLEFTRGAKSQNQKALSVPPQIAPCHAQNQEILAIRLKQLGLCQADFADICGVTPRTVNNWIHGRTKMSDAADLVLELLEDHPAVRNDLIYKTKGAPRGQPFAKGNPFRFGDRRRTIHVAGAQLARAVGGGASQTGPVRR